MSEQESEPQPEQPEPGHLDGLATQAKHDGVDIKPTLLRVMTDLYIKKPTHTPEEERNYTELALRLIDDVDPENRAEIATRLATYATPPSSVLQRLLRDNITVNDSAEPAPDADLSAEEAPGNELSELFFSASADERRLILVNLEYAPLPPAPPIEPAAAAEAVGHLEMAALSHLTASFVQELERILAIPRAQARRLVDDHSGEPLVVAASVLGMPAEVLQRILLCLNPHISQSVQRVYELLTLFEELQPAASLRLLAIWRDGRPAAPQPPVTQPVEQETLAPHQPHYWHVEARERRSARPLLPERPKIRWEEHEQQKAEG